jgi:uncharacterized protein YegP (UPF0339 family)
MSTQRQRRRFEIYPIFSHWELREEPNIRQLWRWRLLAANNRVMADSGHAFQSICQTRKSIKHIRSMMHLAGVIVFDSKGKVTYEA